MKTLTESIITDVKPLAPNAKHLLNELKISKASTGNRLVRKQIRDLKPGDEVYIVDLGETNMGKSAFKSADCQATLTEIRKLDAACWVFYYKTKNDKTKIFYWNTLSQTGRTNNGFEKKAFLGGVDEDYLQVIVGRGEFTLLATSPETFDAQIAEVCK